MEHALSTNILIIPPPPLVSSKKSAHITIDLHTSANFKNFTPRGVALVKCY